MKEWTKGGDKEKRVSKHIIWDIEVTFKSD